MSHSTESLDLKRWESNSTVTEAESLNVSSHEMMGINKWTFYIRLNLVLAIKAHLITAVSEWYQLKLLWPLTPPVLLLGNEHIDDLER